MHSDNAPELLEAMKHLGWANPTSCPGIPQTNHIAEEKVRLCKTGTRAVLEQSGFPDDWWPMASQYYSMTQNFMITDGDSAYNRRHKKGHFKGELLTFDCAVGYMPERAAVSAYGEARHICGLLYSSRGDLEEGVSSD